MFSEMSLAWAILRSAAKWGRVLTRMLNTASAKKVPCSTNLSWTMSERGNASSVHSNQRDHWIHRLSSFDRNWGAPQRRVRRDARTPKQLQYISKTGNFDIPKSWTFWRCVRIHRTNAAALIIWQATRGKAYKITDSKSKEGRRVTEKHSTRF